MQFVGRDIAEVELDSTSTTAAHNFRETKHRKLLNETPFFSFSFPSITKHRNRLLGTEQRYYRRMRGRQIACCSLAGVLVGMMSVSDDCELFVFYSNIFNQFKPLPCQYIFHAVLGVIRSMSVRGFLNWMVLIFNFLIFVDACTVEDLKDGCYHCRSA